MAKTPPAHPRDEPERLDVPIPLKPPPAEDPAPIPEAESALPPAPAMLAEDGAGEGDEVVWVRTLASSALQQCYAKDARGRQIRVDGQMFEHVGEGPDGAWLYEERAY